MLNEHRSYFNTLQNYTYRSKLYFHVHIFNIYLTKKQQQHSINMNYYLKPNITPLEPDKGHRLSFEINAREQLSQRIMVNGEGGGSTNDSFLPQISQ